MPRLDQVPEGQATCQALYVHILDAWINEEMQAQTFSYFFWPLGYLQLEVPIGDCA